MCDTPTGCGSGIGGGEGEAEGGGQGHGRVVVYGDSSCLDEWSAASPICSSLLQAMATYALTGPRDQTFFPDRTKQPSPFNLDDPRGLPMRRPDNELYRYSNVIGKTAGAQCSWQTRRTRRI